MIRFGFGWFEEECIFFVFEGWYRVRELYLCFSELVWELLYSSILASNLFLSILIDSYNLRECHICLLGICYLPFFCDDLRDITLWSIIVDHDIVLLTSSRICHAERLDIVFFEVHLFADTTRTDTPSLDMSIDRPRWDSETTRCLISIEGKSHTKNSKIWMQWVYKKTGKNQTKNSPKCIRALV